jgi:hypothetical protein
VKAIDAVDATGSAENLYAERHARAQAMTIHKMRKFWGTKSIGADLDHSQHISGLADHELEIFNTLSYTKKKVECGPRAAPFHGPVSVRRVFVGTISDPSERGLGAPRFARSATRRWKDTKGAVKGKTGCNYALRSSSKRRPVSFSIRGLLMPTPSDRLLAALSPDSRRVLAPSTLNKTDLSHVAVHKWENTSSRRKVGNVFPATKTNLRSAYSPQQPTQQISLSTTLSRYLTEMSVSHDEAYLKLHEAETMAFLQSKSYSVDDVVAWSRILSVSNAHQVVLRFIATANDLSSPDRLPLPTFLLMFILRSKSLEATSLRLLLDYISKYYVGQLPRSRPTATTQVINQQTALIMIVRLVRHARIVWPNGLEEVAVLATKMLGQDCDRIVDLDRVSIQRFSHLYNRLLALFSNPTSLRPFQSIAIQQRCQFILIRKMTSFSPHLPVTREGFRALTKIQLAHRKTEAERKWATSKALSWPPWKEELLGIEEGNEDPGRDSRAVNVLSRMVEAGYSHLFWEQTARVLAGWDTDGSPTIQSRVLLKRAPILRTADVKLESEQLKSKEQEIWATRILATRTIKEAWACFTSYEKTSGESHTIEPYNAMFARLLHAGKHHTVYDDQITSVVPGDRKETWPESTSPHDFLYVPSDPPSVSEFFEMMQKKGLRPGKRLLTELLDNTQTLEDGFMYINAGRLSQVGKQALLGMTQRPPPEIRVMMRRIGDRLVAAFIRLLCRAQATSKISFTLPRFPRSGKEIYQEEYTRDPFVYAQRLVTALQPSFKPIWHALFQGWNYRISSPQPQALDRSWEGLLSQLRDMDTLGIDLDFDCFRHLGDIMEVVAISHHLVIERQEQGLFGEPNPPWNCKLLCKSIFNAMAYGGSVRSKHDLAMTTSWLPNFKSSTQDQNSLVGIPTPAVLHRTIRILGMCTDYGSILTLLRWMHCFSPQLASVADELANSKLLTRHAMAAVRYFLEEAWRVEHFEHRHAVRGECYPGQLELLMEAREIIEKHPEDWGGWPTDQELCNYHFVNKSKARRMRARPGLGNYPPGQPAEGKRVGTE